MDRSVRVDVVIPVYNEERDLEPSVQKLRAFLQANCPYRWRIVIADNASVDRTPEIGQRLAAQWPEEVAYIRLNRKGRGRALRKAWLESDADVMAYMDVDLSTDLSAFMPLIQPLVEGRYHVATGSRLHPQSRITRSLKREIISRIYNFIVWLLFPRRRFRDAQCGFKAITRQAARELVPRVANQSWFFDTELLLRAEQRGYAVWEVPVIWREDPDTRVKILRTALEDLRGLWRVRRTPDPPPIYTDPEADYPD
ncbi:dolichyl-phosphate beta-glucosyltransferase [Thermoflexus hugenholtzii]|uniref:dolichyl-phosphate beta-glucosyltransferase n=1 Tax=Thermoflexus hugenholtzii JAD2 TaxID=877466 RepID=A0A212QYD8_9CHLR|nr:dolichyl-phosphate beta-glucosyltransferase [Thermoflexus hugenholtzii]SNB64768.1 Glycosyltransferase involved in cell wall bisynthesis [Thermoflexus hugenholtzii JAD2]